MDKNLQQQLLLEILVHLFDCGLREYGLVHAHQVQYAVNIAPVKDAAMLYVPATFVVAANHVVDVAVETIPQPAQVGCTEIDVIPQVIGVAPYSCAGIDTRGCVGHDLHHTDTAITSNHMLIPATFLPGNCQQEVSGESVAG